MKFIVINAEIFEKMQQEINDLAEIVTTLHQNNEDKGPERWLDNQDVCHILNISKRTLQTYRDTGKLPFSKIIGSIYYKTEDVEKLLIKSENKKTCK